MAVICRVSSVIKRETALWFARCDECAIAAARNHSGSALACANGFDQVRALADRAVELYGVSLKMNNKKWRVSPAS